MHKVYPTAETVMVRGVWGPRSLQMAVLDLPRRRAAAATSMPYHDTVQAEQFNETDGRRAATLMSV
jgi:hypothetical protein